VLWRLCIIRNATREPVRCCELRARDRFRFRSRFGLSSGGRRNQRFTPEATLHHVCTPPALSEKHGETSFLGIGEPKVHPVFLGLVSTKKDGETSFQLRFRRVKAGIYAPASATRSGRDVQTSGKTPTAQRTYNNNDRSGSRRRKRPPRIRLLRSSNGARTGLPSTRTRTDSGRAQ